MALLIDIKSPDWMTDDELRDVLLRHAPDADIRVAADPGDLDDVEMLAASIYHPGEALRYPNLKVIQKIGAGVNAILADADLPASIRVVRLQSGTAGPEMAEYALAYVLQEQRHLRQYHAQQARSEWTAYPPRIAAETTVAVLGLGRIGKRVARRFIDNGFRVSGWSRGRKRLAEIDCRSGETGLHALVATADYVVSVLPSTPVTRGMFGRKLFDRFNPAAFFINMGRGDLVDEAGLVAALDAGAFAGAILDVVLAEPLPAASPLWRHPKVQLSPHVSGYHLGDAVADIAENYRRLRAGEALLHPVDRELGY